MVDYTRFQATATRLLEGASQGTVVLNVKGSRSGGTDWAPTYDPDTSYTLSAALRGATDRLIAAGRRQVGDLDMVAAVPTGMDTVPPPGSTVTVDGTRYEVKEATFVPPAGIPVVLKAVLRR